MPIRPDIDTAKRCLRDATVLVDSIVSAVQSGDPEAQDGIAEAAEFAVGLLNEAQKAL